MSYQRRAISGILAARKRCASGKQTAITPVLNRMPAVSDHCAAVTSAAQTNQTEIAAGKLTRTPWRCAKVANTNPITMLAPLIGRLASAPSAMNAASWSSARNT